MSPNHPEEPPFAKHKAAYLTIKLLVLLGAALLALKLLNVL